jgi:uncharacterized protein YbjT (DUF2867 family)
MKVLVIGATGLTGTIATKLLLEGGAEVTAFVRRPDALSEREGARCRLAIGEARDAASLERAVMGHDAVLSTFGPRSLGRDDLQEVFMKNLVSAMEKTGVKRLSNLSAWGVGDSFRKLAWFARPLARLFVGRLFDDKERGERHLFASGLDYVNARPGRLSNGRARGGIKASLDPSELRWWPLVTREDLAAFMVGQLTDDRWVRQSPLLGYGR